MAVVSGVRAAMAGGAFALAAFVLAPAASLAQSAENPSDILAPAERETFTFTFRSTALPEINVWTLDDAPSLELSAGQKWRFKFDLDSRGAESVELDGVRAGAFFNVTPRMSFGGALSFSGEDNAITRAGGSAFERDVPEVKFESAFRF